MAPELETRIGLRCDAALIRVRTKVFRVGTAGVWHASIARKIISKPALLDQAISRMDELSQARYLSALPALLGRMQEQDDQCAACWRDSSRSQASPAYLLQLDKLQSLFISLEFNSKQYERLVRSTEKPILVEATRLTDLGEESSEEAIAIENALRMRIRDYVVLEEQMAQDLAEVYRARDELCSAHEDLVHEIVLSQTSRDASTEPSARIGIQRAAGYYDYTRGFSFRSYAQHWIQEAIDKRWSERTTR